MEPLQAVDIDTLLDSAKTEHVTLCHHRVGIALEGGQGRRRWHAGKLMSSSVIIATEGVVTERATSASLVPGRVSGSNRRYSIGPVKASRRPSSCRSLEFSYDDTVAGAPALEE